MRCTTRFAIGCIALFLTLNLFVGCYESMDQPQPAAGSSQQSQESGPLTSQMSQGGGSALGGAKKSATNVAEHAQQAHERAAKDAGIEDELPAPPTDDEP